MSSAESYRAFDAANSYLRGQPMSEPRDYVSPICGDRLLANLNNDDGLEADREYYYITHDNGRDLRVWKSKRERWQKLPTNLILFLDFRIKKYLFGGMFGFPAFR